MIVITDKLALSIPLVINVLQAGLTWNQAIAKPLMAALFIKHAAVIPAMPFPLLLVFLLTLMVQATQREDALQAIQEKFFADLVLV